LPGLSDPQGIALEIEGRGRSISRGPSGDEEKEGKYGSQGKTFHGFFQEKGGFNG
jgi:hypothetical protein